METVVTWSDDLSVGIQQIDEQHKVLINLLNELNDAIHTGSGKEIRIGVLNKLIEYTRIHFTVEESLMRLLGYSKYDEHKQEHEDLLSEVLAFRDQYVKDPDASSYNLVFFLKRWLSTHIMKADKAYEKHFLNMGVKKSWLKSSWLDRFWSK